MIHVSPVGSKVAAMLVAGLLLIATPGAVSAAEPFDFGDRVSVVLASGRRFTANIDSRSDAQTLWLRFGNEAASVRRPIEWNRIVTAKLIEPAREVAVAEMKAVVLRLRAAAGLTEAEPARTPRPAPTIRTIETARTLSPTTSEPTQLVAGARPALPAIRGLYFDAQLEPWIGPTPEAKLAIVVRPFDDFHHTVPVNGTLEISLYAPQVRDFSAAPRNSGFAVDRVGHWQFATRVDQFRPEGFAVHVPLRAAMAQQLASHFPYGIVQVRLTVPGVGVFEKTRDDVRLQSFSPVRDFYQQRHQRRTLPFERPGMF